MCIILYNYASVTAFSPSYKLVNTDKLSFSVQMASVMKQKGSFDCGLFTIYMTCVSYNLDPSLCVFEQTKMSSHFQMEPFSVKKERRSTCVPKVLSLLLLLLPLQ